MINNRIIGARHNSSVNYGKQKSVHIPEMQLLLRRYLHTNWRSNFYIRDRDRICHLAPLLATVENKKHSRRKAETTLSISTAWCLYSTYRGMLPRHWPPTKPSVWISEVQHNPLIKSGGESLSYLASCSFCKWGRGRKGMNGQMNTRLVYFFSLKIWLWRGHRWRESSSSCSRLSHMKNGKKKGQTRRYMTWFQTKRFMSS